MAYLPGEERYNTMKYNRVGRSGLKLPAISLGMWHNFASFDSYENQRALVRKAFDLGITHFDLANNYGGGFAEENIGRILKTDLAGYRDELVISTKAGFPMWSGPYGDWGSKKHLTASLDQSLKRLGLDYVDIYYHHRPDPETPLEETIGALSSLVKQGKVLYIGVSSYDADRTKKAAEIAKQLGTPLTIHQPLYSMFNRWIEGDLQNVLEQEGMGSIAFCPLDQGLLTSRYLKGIPEDSRASKPSGYLQVEQVTEDKLSKVRRLNEIAVSRGQSLAQMALAWALRGGKLTSALIGASKVSQIEENVQAVNKLDFTADELKKIDEILK